MADDPVSPSALSWRTPCSKPHTAIDAAAIANLNPLGYGQLDPAGDHRAGEVAVADEQHVAGLHVRQRQRDRPVGAFATPEPWFSPPGQPCVHTSQFGTCLPDLISGQCPRSRRSPIRPDQRVHLVDGEPGQFGSHRRALPRAADARSGLFKLQLRERRRRRLWPALPPISVRSRSVLLVCLPLRDHSVSP